MGAIASKWDEMNQVNEAIEQAEKKERVRKKSVTDRIKTRILKSDPRSATEDVDRTPIAVEKPCETPVRHPKELVDPRSPGVVIGDVVLERTPLLVFPKSEDKDSTPMRGTAPPPFSLPETPNNDSLCSESPRMDISSIITSTPTTIPLVQKARTGESHPSNMLQEKLKGQAIAAMKEKANDKTTAGSASDLDVQSSGLNDSSLVI